MTNHLLARGECFASLRVLALALVVGCAQSALAQKYPVKTVRMLVGSAAGGGLDAAARAIASKLSEALGESVLIENRTGATGIIAAGAVATAVPDGYTLLYCASQLLIAPSVFKSVPFDPVRSFTAVGGVGSVPLMIVVSNGVPARTTAELIALLKANPGKYSYGSTGVGSVHHMAMELFRKQAGVDIVHVPYKGAAQFMPDLISGVLPMAMVSAESGVPQIKAGKFRAIAHTRPGRLAPAPDVPPIADTFPGFDVGPAEFILAPAGTPAEVVARLSEALRTVLSADDTRRFFLRQGTTLEFLAPEALAKRIQIEVPMWSAVAKEAGIQPE